LLRTTEGLAARCRIDGVRDLGLGTVHFPENHLLGLPSGRSPLAELRERCTAAVPLRYPGLGGRALHVVTERLDDELAFLGPAKYAGYFLTVAEICRMIRDLGARVSARGSGVGSLVNHLLGISWVDPVGHDLLMERFVSPLRSELPDIDLDVQSDRRREIQRAVLERFGPDRVTSLCTMETYRARQAIRDAARALGLPGAQAGAIAMSFPHLRARQIRSALSELPELRALRPADGGTDRLFDLAELLDGLPRHTALHPCGIVLSDGGLLDRTPLETGGGAAPGGATPMSQFGTSDVERLGLLKLDLLGIRMHSAMAHALREIARVDGPDAARAGGHAPSSGYLCSDTGRIDLEAIPLDDPRTFELIRSTRTIGCFQIESPGQRELLGRFEPETFEDLVLDISLFRPGPMASDTVTPFLRARRGGRRPPSLHPSLDPILRPTYGVVLFHEQILRIVSITSGCSLARADEVRRALSTELGRQEIHDWWWPLALSCGYGEPCARRIWQVLVAFGAFGFCKAHAAAFAVPTYQSAWLKAHHPAAFLAGVLTHDPGMYPRRLILQEARLAGVEILPLDVNRSGAGYRVERLGERFGERLGEREHPSGPPTGHGYGIRLSLSDVKGIRGEAVDRIVAHAPYTCLEDFRQRAAPPQPVTERLLLAGAFDSLHALAPDLPDLGRTRTTRRDLLLHLRDLERRPSPAARRGTHPGQLSLDQLSPELRGELHGAPRAPTAAGLPGTTPAELARAQLEILGLDACRHVMEEYAPLLDGLGITTSGRLLERRNRSELLVAGVKVAVQTPAVRSGQRLVFLTLDDATGPVDLVLFPDAGERYAGTVLTCSFLLARGILRRSGPRGACVRATGAWDLVRLKDLYDRRGRSAVLRELEDPRDPADC
ncbi:MAG: error-prone polymerase, partial [Actinomycetota bacterium]|nr:error-prone polymerase [Actinomycetota bacterium]